MLSPWLIGLMALIVTVCGSIVMIGVVALRKELEAARSEATELRRTIKRNGELARDIAHELKNPITAILCSAETLNLLLGDTLTDNNRRCLRYIKEYGDQVLRMVSNFLDLSVGEAGFLSAHPGPVEAVKTVHAVTGLLGGLADQKNVTIGVSGSEDVVFRADPRHIKQILFNLIHNAIKFTPKNGVIAISVNPSEDCCWCSITIKDTGVGMTDDTRKALFERGESKVNPLIDQNEAGVGLGLKLCRRLVKLSAGHLTVESTPHLGTSVTVTFPLIHGARPDAKDSTMERQDSLSGQSFLVVEEDTGARESIAQLITALGGVADAVGHIDDALKAVSERCYSVVMLDPNGDTGTDSLIDTLRQNSKDSGTRIILATSNGNSTPSVSSKADGEIQKPLNGKALIQSVATTAS